MTLSEEEINAKMTSQCGSKTLVLIKDNKTSLDCKCYRCKRKVTIKLNRYSRLEANAIRKSLS